MKYEIIPFNGPRYAVRLAEGKQILCVCFNQEDAVLITASLNFLESEPDYTDQEEEKDL